MATPHLLWYELTAHPAGNSRTRILRLLLLTASVSVLFVAIVSQYIPGPNYDSILLNVEDEGRDLRSETV